MSWPAPTFAFGDFVTMWDRHPGVIVDVDPTSARKYLVATWDSRRGVHSEWCGFMDITHDLEAYR